MSPERRLLRFHELSEELFDKVVHTKSEAERATLIALANGWRELATETEELLRAKRGG